MIQVGLRPELNVSVPDRRHALPGRRHDHLQRLRADAAGFDLDDGDIKTEVRLHHGTHFHPFVGPLTGRAGSFTIPTDRRGLGGHLV